MEEQNGRQTPAQGRVYLTEDKDGFLTRVPEDKMEAWAQAQQGPKRPLNRFERLLAARISESLYGTKK